MKIQLNTDKNIQGTEALESRVNTMLEQYLGRFFARLTRIEVHLSDSNAGKGGTDDKRCSLEARLEGEDPVGATHDAENVEKAIRGACDKLKGKLETLVGKRRGH